MPPAAGGDHPPRTPRAGKKGGTWSQGERLRHGPPRDEGFAAQMRAAEEVMREDRDVLRELARR